MNPRQNQYYATHHVPWYAGVSDPGAIGWVVVGAYAITAILAIRATLVMPSNAADRSDRLIWMLIVAALLALGINKQLDLQTWVIEEFRGLALDHGWYGWRRGLQAIGFALALVASSGGVIVAVRLVRRSKSTLLWALVGMAIIGAYVLVRAATFAHVLTERKVGILSGHWNWLIELAGIATVAAAAVVYRRRKWPLAG